MCMPPITKNHSKNIHKKALKLNEGHFYHQWDDPRPEPSERVDLNLCSVEKHEHTRKFISF